MKIVNGKLFGQPQNELDIYKESQTKQNHEIKNFLQYLDQRVDKTENSLKGEALRDALFRNLESYVQKLEDRCSLMEQEQNKFKKLEQRWAYIENIKFSQIESNLHKVKKLIPIKLMWLTFGSSLIVGTVSLCSWLNVFPSEPRPKEVIYNLAYPKALETPKSNTQGDSPTSNNFNQ